MTDNREWGLAAYGRSGDIEIEIDEATSGSPAWELSIDTPHANLRFSISELDVVDRMLRFLDEERSEWGEIEIGEFSGAKILLVRDHPPTARCWIKCVPESGFLSLEFSDDLEESLREAIRDVSHDMDE